MGHGIIHRIVRGGLGDHRRVCGRCRPSISKRPTLVMPLKQRLAFSGAGGEVRVDEGDGFAVESEGCGRKGWTGSVGLDSSGSFGSVWRKVRQTSLRMTGGWGGVGENESAGNDDRYGK
jgi:hypothetical protein